MNARHLGASCHLGGPQAYSLARPRQNGRQTGGGGRRGHGRHIEAQDALQVRGLGTDVLSTQSTSDPEVVKGMRESIAVEGTLAGEVVVRQNVSERGQGCVCASYVQASVQCAIRE